MPTSETGLKFARLVLPVRDLELMAAFYRDVIGFSQMDAASSTELCFDAGGLMLCLRTAAAPMRDDQAVGPVLVFNTADVAQLRDQLIEQGVRMGKLKSFGSMVECDGRDPEGNIFRVANHA
ncbi:MAG TPA: VOC family protein [Tepidisphaeraceae bacterium]|nr:VOC family protein [Tepidisphaeraceae bacterium]